jgi:hypothetical protein
MKDMQNLLQEIIGTQTTEDYNSKKKISLQRLTTTSTYKEITPD